MPQESTESYICSSSVVFQAEVLVSGRLDDKKYGAGLCLDKKISMIARLLLVVTIKNFYSY